MFEDDISILCDKMNKYGEQKLPFLFAVNYEMTEGFFISNPKMQSDVLFEMDCVGNKPACSFDDMVHKLRVTPMSKNQYENKFIAIQNAIEKGDISLLNLTAKSSIITNLSMHDIFMQSSSKFQLYVPDKFVCFSPEQFVEIAEGQIKAYPMKGTIDASIPDAKEVILNDPKEIKEHQNTVNQVCDELNLVGTNARVERFRYIIPVKGRERSILQVSSEVVADLASDYLSRLGDIVFGMLPAGSICGVPKAKAMEVIAQVEDEPRGYYSGVFGYFDGETFTSAVLIRFIESDKGNLYYHSGGGITADSQCEKEYQEMLNKIYLCSTH